MDNLSANAKSLPNEDLSLQVEGLDCAHCATKLEHKIKKINNINEAYVDLLNNKIKIKHNSVNESDLISLVRDAGTSLGVDISKNYAPQKFSLDKGLKFRIIRYCIGALIFCTAFILNLPYLLNNFLLIISFIIFGYDVMYKAITSIFNKDIFNENFLMTTASIGAIYIGMPSEAILVMAFFQVGEFFQDMAVSRSRKSIADLMNIRPDYANKVIGDEVVQVSPEQININDIIIIKPGEKIPLDGTIIEGKSQIDISSLMGESVPRTVKEDEDVLSGSINLTSLLKVRVTNNYENSTVTKILDMVENAGAKKSQTERFITRFARIYTPIVVVLALALMFIPILFFPYAYANEWVYRGIVFLLVSCPCALHLSVPLSFFSGVGASSKNGVLIKGSVFLQTLSKANIFVFDKTGTITKGFFRVTKINSANISERELLKVALSLEAYSNHPIAKSIIQECTKRHIDEDPTNITEDFEEIFGLGLKANINGKLTLAGNAKLMEMHNMPYNKNVAEGTIVHISQGNTYLGHIEISDIIKPDSMEGIQNIKKSGVKKTIMLSGDRRVTAESVATQVGIDEIYSELLPNQKVEILEQIYKENPGATIAFVGDGINDAPVLTRANVGIAMGGIGSDAAVESSDVVIMSDQIPHIVTAINISKKTMKRVMQNIYLVMLVKFAVLILTAIGMGNILFAIIADTGITMLAVLNSIRGNLNR